MTLEIGLEVLEAIQASGAKDYPEEGAGLLLGRVNAGQKRVTAAVELPNSRENTARRNRYLVSPADYLWAESEAAKAGLDILGVYHSHPDHPERPSEFDRQWALPWFSYLITSVYAGGVVGSRSWLLDEDRSGFVEEEITILEDQGIKRVA